MTDCLIVLIQNYSLSNQCRSRNNRPLFVNQWNSSWCCLLLVQSSINCLDICICKRLWQWQFWVAF